MSQLRLFVSSQNLVSRLLAKEGDENTQASELFQAVCRDILGTTQAQLTPLAALAPLAGPGLIYSTAGNTAMVAPPNDLTTDIMVLTPQEHGGYQWAIPLWAARGLIGVVMIGAKRDGGLYTQEEMEIAQAAGERLVDMLAGETMAQSLMRLQRQRGAENRVVDMRMRRALHDDILPSLHTAILQCSSLSSAQTDLSDTIATLSDLHQQISNLIRTSAQHVQVPGDSTFDDGIRQIIDNEFKHAFASISIEGNTSMQVDPLLSEVLFGALREVIRNAAVHGRGTNEDRPLSLRICITETDGLLLEIADDGVGLHHNLGGLPTGSGSGLALHGTLLATVGGTLSLDSNYDRGTQVQIHIPEYAAS